MPRTSDMVESKYIKKGDVGPGQLWTIRAVDRINVAKEDDEPEYKWALHFNEIKKPMTLNVTNIKMLEMVCGSDNTDDWTGKQVVVYYDPTVMYAGEAKGGLRIRAPKSAAEQALPF